MENEKRVTFHGHENHSEIMVNAWLQRAGVLTEDQVKITRKLVKGHQFRFYEDTKKATIRKWMVDLGRAGWRAQLRLRISDRRGNDNKPQQTPKELTDLFALCTEMEKKKEVLYKEDLQITDIQIVECGIPYEYTDRARQALLAVAFKDRSKNKKKYLMDYLIKHRASIAYNFTTIEKSIPFLTD